MIGLDLGNSPTLVLLAQPQPHQILTGGVFQPDRGLAWRQDQGGIHIKLLEFRDLFGEVIGICFDRLVIRRPPIREEQRPLHDGEIVVFRSKHGGSLVGIGRDRRTDQIVQSGFFSGRGQRLAPIQPLQQ
ncbi:hypothetical protein CCR82_02295 [Halochromatium salexigens]|uniref:Uncharacterized protein n=1 Tax=Halochromatium salexigens TaxID=49447 RepID=A0AAJ0UDM7_HALSE|nr:hypothetical protein [Halochromatium salexigens]